MPEVTRADMLDALRERVVHLEYGRGPLGKRLHELDCMRAALRELEAGGWRDMESAPRDGTRILLGYYARGEAVVAHWSNDIGKFVLSDGDKYGIAGRSAPRGWMLLPSPPPPTTSDGGGE